MHTILNFNFTIFISLIIFCYYFVWGRISGVAFMLMTYPIGVVVKLPLRTVPTIVIAHTFCASPDTWISYRQSLLIQGYFCTV